MAILPKSAVSGSWTIHDKNGRVALEFDSFLGLDYRGESRVAAEPVEEGSFASFNKVSTPYLISLRLAKSGSDLSGFVTALESLKGSLDLFSIVTPEKVYPSANIVSVAYARRREDGADRLVAELGIVEIRQVTPAYQDTALSASRTKQGGDASARARGKQQGSDASTAQTKRTSTLYGVLG